MKIRIGRAVRLLVLPLAVLWVGSAFAGQLSDKEVADLRSQLQVVQTAFDHGDAKGMLDATHPAIFAAAGGRDKLEAMLTTAAAELPKEMEAMGMKLRSRTYGKPTPTYSAGDEELCFVPSTIVLDAKGHTIKSQGFMVAIRKKGGSDWKFLDGEGVKKNPELLYKLFPALEPGVEIPKANVEIK